LVPHGVPSLVPYWRLHWGILWYLMGTSLVPHGGLLWYLTGGFFGPSQGLLWDLTGTLGKLLYPRPSLLLGPFLAHHRDLFGTSAGPSLVHHRGPSLVPHGVRLWYLTGPTLGPPGAITTSTPRGCLWYPTGPSLVPHGTFFGTSRAPSLVPQGSFFGTSRVLLWYCTSQDLTSRGLLFGTSWCDLWHLTGMSSAPPTALVVSFDTVPHKGLVWNLQVTSLEQYLTGSVFGTSWGTPLKQYCASWIFFGKT
jgi:hypothetical protein